LNAQDINLRKLFEVNYGSDPRVAGVPYRPPGRAWIAQCDRSGIRYVTPEPDFEQIRRCYAKAETTVWRDDPVDGRRRGYWRMVKLIESNLSKPNPSMCDVGCYTGGFAKSFGQQWRRYGIEPSSKAAEAAAEAGVQILGTDWSEVLPGRQFDCVTLLSVIEHVYEQDALIDTVRAALNPFGLVFIETGDYDSWWARFMGPRWYYYNLPEHVAFHSRHSLCRLLERHGFEVVAALGHRTHKRSIGWIGRASAFKRLATGTVKRLVGPSSEPYRALWRDHQWVLARRGTCYFGE